jgi:hypothetical protein
MKWPTKLEKEPQGGETRSYLKFAWKPIVIGTWTVWLEYYEVTDQYIGRDWITIETFVRGSKTC